MSEPHSASLFARVGGRLLRSRRLMRAPAWIYRARAGVLFGSRILMLEHVGRKSGVPRYAVLEVVDHPTPDTYVVASGFGRKAQWFRNIQASAGPCVRRQPCAEARHRTRPRPSGGTPPDGGTPWERFGPVMSGEKGS